MKKEKQASAFQNVVGQVINLLNNNLSTYSSEYFEGWCENGDIFENADTEQHIMEILAPAVNNLVDKIEELRQADIDYKDACKLFNLKTLEELNTIVQENKFIAHKNKDGIVKIVYNNIVVTLVESVTFAGDLYIIQSYKIVGV